MVQVRAEEACLTFSLVAEKSNLTSLDIVLLWQARYDPDRFHADSNHLPHQPDDVFWVVGSVRVGLNAAAFVFAHLVLVDHPFEGAGVAKAVLEGFGGMSPRVREG